MAPILCSFRLLYPVSVVPQHNERGRMYASHLFRTLPPVATFCRVHAQNHTKNTAPDCVYATPTFLTHSVPNKINPHHQPVHQKTKHTHSSMYARLSCTRKIKKKPWPLDPCADSTAARRIAEGSWSRRGHSSSCEISLLYCSVYCGEPLITSNFLSFLFLFFPFSNLNLCKMPFLSMFLCA